ncbi:hypothetical protein E1301_Tti014374 [Triplophysa tibetana]|uniref:Ig-like domain-containing protein n=1 Tax=Triplophysa tibetana TaxID=1572043 RepID=A0A5A9P5H3_9TELE|nr:hypothetical protein E1301_Tti014374 [Triplophysa tibetana]
MVRPGDNAMLLCDRQVVVGQDTHWVKICSSQILPPLIVSAQKTLLLPISRFSVIWNNISKSFDLMIENITDADLGLYYCSTVEKQFIEHNRLPFEKDVYHTGDTLTRLTYASSDNNECSGSSVFKKSRGLPNTSEMQREEQIQEQDDIEEICYTSLNIPKQRSKLKRNDRIPNADNITIKTECGNREFLVVCRSRDRLSSLFASCEKPLLFQNYSSRPSGPLKHSHTVCAQQNEICV